MSGSARVAFGRPLIFSALASWARGFVKVIAYIDGFNLYHGCLKGTPYRWLDLHQLVANILRTKPSSLQVKYFTARVSAKTKASSPVTQAMYLRALQHSGVEIFEGNFAIREKWIPEVGTGIMRHVTVYEEKGSDVNLATHLVFDACQKRFDRAVVVTNDTDLVEPIAICTRELAASVWLCSPYPRAHTGLVTAATTSREIKTAWLRSAQFPLAIPHASGLISKPEKWVAQDIVFLARELTRTGDRAGAIRVLNAMAMAQEGLLFNQATLAMLRRCQHDPLEPANFNVAIEALWKETKRA